MFRLTVRYCAPWWRRCVAPRRYAAVEKRRDEARFNRCPAQVFVYDPTYRRGGYFTGRRCYAVSRLACSTRWAGTSTTGIKSVGFGVFGGRPRRRLMVSHSAVHEQLPTPHSARFASFEGSFETIGYHRALDTDPLGRCDVADVLTEEHLSGVHDGSACRQFFPAPLGRRQFCLRFDEGCHLPVSFLR